MSDFWKSCLLQLEQELPSQQFSTWILPLRLEPEVGVEDAFRLLVPNGFHQKWVKDRYLSRIESLGGEFFARPVQVSIAIAPKASKVLPTEKSIDQENTGNAPVIVATDSPPVSKDRPTGALGVKNAAADKNRLLYDFTFDNLVVGRANDLARAAAIKVSQQPGAAYNPLFIYGGAGFSWFTRSFTSCKG